MNSGTIEGLGRLAIKELKTKFDTRLDGEKDDVMTDGNSQAT
jgi:hypothetical protein